MGKLSILAKMFKFQILVTYGHRHKDYGVTLHMLELMGKCFVVSIQGQLEDAEW